MHDVGRFKISAPRLRSQAGCKGGRTPRSLYVVVVFKQHKNTTGTGGQKQCINGIGSSKGAKPALRQAGAMKWNQAVYQIKLREDFVSSVLDWGLWAFSAGKEVAVDLVYPRHLRHKPQQFSYQKRLFRRPIVCFSPAEHELTP